LTFSSDLAAATASAHAEISNGSSKTEVFLSEVSTVGKREVRGGIRYEHCCGWVCWDLEIPSFPLLFPFPSGQFALDSRLELSWYPSLSSKDLSSDLRHLRLFGGASFLELSCSGGSSLDVRGLGRALAITKKDEHGF
jgi:hypothetical protein